MLIIWSRKQIVVCPLVHSFKTLQWRGSGKMMLCRNTVLAVSGGLFEWFTLTGISRFLVFFITWFLKETRDRQSCCLPACQPVSPLESVGWFQLSLRKWGRFKKKSFYKYHENQRMGKGSRPKWVPSLGEKTGESWNVTCTLWPAIWLISTCVA